MKKSLLIALIGFMFVAFASCAGGSKEYRDAKAAIEKATKIIDNASTCDDLMNADMEMDADEETEYAEADMMTPEEKEEIAKLAGELVTKTFEKSAELCQ